jgi:hypothetical protein
MKNIPAALLTALESGQVATLITVTLTNGTVYGYTDHDAPLTVNGQLYVPIAGQSVLKMNLTSDASVSTQDVVAAWTPVISEQALLEGLYDFAAVEFALCSWSSPALGSVTVFGGRIGRVSYIDKAFTAQAFSNMWSLSQNIGIEFTANCRHKFGATQDPQGVGGCFYNASGQVYQGAIVGEIINEVEFYVGMNSATPGTPNSPNAPSLSATPVFPSTSGGVQYLAPTEGTPYAYSVSAIVDGVESPSSPISVIYTTLSIQGLPTFWQSLFQAVLPGNAVGSTITVSWNAVAGATAYNVYGRDSQTLLATVTGTSWTDNGSASGGTINPPYGDFFSNGFLTMTSGQANGLSREVKFCHSGKLQLWLPFERPVAVGDTFNITVGCIKTAPACQYKFNNLVNFGGFPGIKPQVLYTTPQTGTGSAVKK